MARDSVLKRLTSYPGEYVCMRVWEVAFSPQHRQFCIRGLLSFGAAPILGLAGIFSEGFTHLSSLLYRVR